MAHGWSRAGRVAVIAALCALAAVGLQARGAFTGGSGWVGKASAEATFDAAIFGSGAGLMACATFFALMVRLRRRKRPGGAGPAQVSWWTRSIAILTTLCVIAGLVALIEDAHRSHLVTRRPAVLGLPRDLRGITGASTHASAGGWLLLAGMLAAGLALVVAALVLRRRRLVFGLRESEGDEPADEQLREALSAGTVALAAADDPRAAIIACYAAMEHSLAGAGAAPGAADTPDEVLARAAAGGLIRSPAAGQLTGLFRRARYGGRAMAEADRADARSALARLRSDLGGAT
jgi:hypothetical protein